MEVNEALSIQQRIKRANIAHRNANKLKVARDRSARKLAPESNIKSRAYAVARKILRKRIAGGRGAVYQELGPTEKISIDKQLDKKKALIKKIAMRLIPRIRQSEQHRLQSFLKGKAMKNDINEAFEKKFKKTKKKPDSYIKFFNKFTEENQNNTGAYKSLLKKSEKHGVDVEAIGDIYNEAFNDFDNVETNLTPEQYAFSRVNHELNELSKQTLGSYIKKATPEIDKHADRYHKGVNGHFDDTKISKTTRNAGRKLVNREDGVYIAKKKMSEDLEESKNTPYVKPYEQNGQHVGWKASNKHGKLKFFGKQFKASANKHAGITEQTAYSQSELGKHVKTYKNVRGSKYDLYKNLNGHKLVNRISGASEDYPHQNTRELHKKLLKTLLPEETSIDEAFSKKLAALKNGRSKKEVLAPAHTVAGLNTARIHHNQEHDIEVYHGMKVYKTQGHYVFHNDKLVHTTLSRPNAISHAEKLAKRLDKEKANLKESLDEDVKFTLVHETEHKKIYHINDKYHGKDHIAYQVKHYDRKGGFGFAATMHRTLNAPKEAGVKVAHIKHPILESLDEGRYIVSGTHEDQGFSKTKVYKADSEEHAKKQFHDEFEKFNARKIKKLTLNKMKNEDHKVGDKVLHDIKGGNKGTILSKANSFYRVKFDKEENPRTIRNSFLKKVNEEHDKCGTPECCGQCEPLDEFVVTAALIAGVAAAKKVKKEAPKVGNYVKNQAFSQAGHLKDKVAGIISKKEAPETRMSSKEYLKKREAMVKEETDLTDRIEILAERNKDNKFKKDLYVAKKGQQASKVYGINHSNTADRVGHDHHIDYGDNDDHNDDASARHGSRKTAVRIYKKLGRSRLKEGALEEVLGPENQIGTKALVKKLQKLTPGQEKAQVNEQYEKELIHHGVILHKTNTERKNERGGYTSDHKVIKWSKEYEINPNLKTFSGKGAGHAHQLAHQKAVRDHPEVKKHLKDGWSVETFKIDASKKPILDHINNKLAYIKKQNGSLHLAEELDLDEACWKGYKQLGIKKKGAKTVPNCVKEDVTSSELKGVIVPAYVDGEGNTVPAKTIKRKEGNKILRTGNMQDGK